MKEKHRILAILLSLVMVFAYMPVLGFADTEESQEVKGSVQKSGFQDFDGDGDPSVNYINADGIRQKAYRTSDGYAYTLVNSDGLDTVRVIGYNGSSTTLDVPEKIHNRKVSGFSIDPDKPVEDENYNNIKSITLPDSMIYFRTRNLEKFRSLESVSGKGGELDNDRYKTADGVLYKKYSSGMTAFYPLARKSKSWVMEPGCNDWVCFPEKCPLETITLSSTFRSGYRFEAGSFPDMKAFDVPPDNNYLSSADGVLYNKEGTRLYRYPPKKEGSTFTVPDGVDALYDAFNSCVNLQTIVLPGSITYIDEEAFGGCTGLKTVRFTSKVAPSVEMAHHYYGLRAMAFNTGLRFEYPEDGTGYDAFIDELKNAGGLAPIPNDPEILEVDELKDITLAPGEVVTLKFTADKLCTYGLGVWSDEAAMIDWCYLKGFSYGEDIVNRYCQTYPYDETTEGETNYMCGAAPGESIYVQIRADESNTTSAYKIKITHRGPIALADIPENCDELVFGETMRSTISDAEDVITYKIQTDAVENYQEQEDFRCRIEVTRTETQSGEEIYWSSALMKEGSTFGYGVIWGCEDSISRTEYLDAESTYYLQLKPGVAGECTVRITIFEEDNSDYDRYGFADVPESDIEKMSVGDEKTITTEAPAEHEEEGEYEGGSTADTYTYVFEPEVSGDYTFCSEGSSDVVGRVLQGETVLGVNDDSGTAGRANFAVHFHAEAGQKYYLQAKLYYGGAATFTLKLIDYIGEHKHDLEYVDAVAGSSEGEEAKNGTIGYFRCTVCGEMFADRSHKHRVYEDTISVSYGSLITSLEFVPVEGTALSGETGDIIGSQLNRIGGFFAEGNKFIITFDDGHTNEYICVKAASEDGEEDLGYYLDGDTSKSGFDGSLKAIVQTDDRKLATGNNKVFISMWRYGQYAECTVDITAEWNGEHEHSAGEAVKENESAATCNAEGGYDEVVYCTICGEELSRTHVVLDKIAHTWGAAEYVWNDEYTEVTGSHTCSVCGETETEIAKRASSEVTKVPTLEENGEIVYTSEAFASEGFEMQTVIVETDPLTLDEVLKQASTAADEAGGKTDTAEESAETSTDENDAADAEDAAVKAAELAAMAEAAADKTLEDAQAAIDKLIEDGASEEEIADAQTIRDTAAANAAAAKQLVAAANSIVARAKKAAAKIASNKASALYDAAKNAANSAAANELSKEAEVQAAIAAEKALAANSASETADKAASDLKDMAEKYAGTEAEEVIKEAEAEADAAAIIANEAAGAADESSGNAETSANNAKTVANDKAQAEADAAKAANEGAAAAAAERARQGTPDSKIPKVKGFKKSAAKKTSITVKWTKLTKKQLKKSKATKYEIWVCPNTAFGAADTKIKTVGKGKSSAKISGLKKNTKYYVKVRAIRTVGNVKYVGKWSSRKTVRTPKK